MATHSCWRLVEQVGAHTCTVCTAMSIYDSHFCYVTYILIFKQTIGDLLPVYCTHVFPVGAAVLSDPTNTDSFIYPSYVQHIMGYVYFFVNINIQ